VQVDAKDLVGLLPQFLNANVNLVVDHFGRPSPQQGVSDPGFQALLAAASSRRVWVKLSGPYRFSPEVTDAAAPLLRKAFGPDRLLWGSDWPFTQFEKTNSYPQARAWLDAWVPDADERTIILTSTPTRLFQFSQT
jgi:predicted TIM-barrel fold metal-dependent hydrolase